MDTMTISSEYQRALAMVREAGAVWRAAQLAYRTRKIDTAAFLDARAIFRTAERAYDLAYAAESTSVDDDTICEACSE